MSLGVRRTSPSELGLVPSAPIPAPPPSAPVSLEPARERDYVERGATEGGSATATGRAYASSETGRAERMLAAYAGRSKGAGRAKEEAAPAEAPALPPPPDLARLAELRERADDFTPSASTVDAERASEIRAELARAEERTLAGDYAGAAAAYERLGFPLPEDLADASDAAYDTAMVIGGAELTTGEDGTAGVALHAGSHGDVHLNDLDGLAANARMMAALSEAGIHPAGNPPTREEARAYMEHVARESGGDPRAALDASRLLIDGMVVHYSAAGESNPSYARDARRYVLVTDPGSGERLTFDSRRAAEREARARGLSTDDVHTVTTELPSSWDEAMALDTRAGRHVGDCESKLYLQHQLLDAAGFEALGSISVEHGDAGHALGVLRAPDGSVWVTSNEDSYAVHGTRRDGAVTEADIERTAEAAIRDVYRLAPGDSVESFAFAYGAEPADSVAEPGVESARRAAENGELGIDEAFLRD